LSWSTRIFSFPGMTGVPFDRAQPRCAHDVPYFSFVTPASWQRR
jgi:hypothetical protein